MSQHAPASPPPDRTSMYTAITNAVARIAPQLVWPARVKLMPHMGMAGCVMLEMASGETILIDMNATDHGSNTAFQDMVICPLCRAVRDHRTENSTSTLRFARSGLSSMGVGSETIVRIVCPKCSEKLSATGREPADQAALVASVFAQIEANETPS